MGTKTKPKENGTKIQHDRINFDTEKNFLPKGYFNCISY